VSYCASLCVIAFRLVGTDALDAGSGHSPKTSKRIEAGAMDEALTR
jgi:hypothetical protein